jgi:hypothetical protein
VPGIAWQLELVRPAQVFSASASIQEQVVLSLPASAFPAVAGLTLRFQAVTFPSAGGVAVPSFSNAVDVTLP